MAQGRRRLHHPSIPEVIWNFSKRPTWGLRTESSQCIGLPLAHPGDCAVGASNRGRVVAAVLWWVLATPLWAVAQPAASVPEVGSLPDTIAQRAQACVACHGRQGSATNAGYFPRLAGKPARYLFNQLRSFRDGRRYNTHMNHIVSVLTDDYLLELATWFSQLDYPYAAPTASLASPEQLARGRTLVMEGDAARDLPACVSCHGRALTGVQPGIPGLLGLPALYLGSQLGAWQTRTRHALLPDCMAEVGVRLSADEVRAVSAWLAAQPVPARGKPTNEIPDPIALRCSAMQP